MPRTVTISSTRISFTVEELENLINDAKAVGADNKTDVEVDVAPTYSSPTDPGGEITISISVTKAD